MTGVPDDGRNNALGQGSLYICICTRRFYCISGLLESDREVLMHCRQRAYLQQSSLDNSITE